MTFYSLFFDYELVIPAVFSEGVSHEYDDLYKLFLGIYEHTIKYKIDPNVISINHYYLTLYHQTFRIKYDKGLIMFNENNKFKLSSIFPGLTVFDKTVSKMIKNRSGLEMKEIVPLKETPSLKMKELIPSRETPSLKMKELIPSRETPPLKTSGLIPSLKLDEVAPEKKNIYHDIFANEEKTEDTISDDVNITFSKRNNDPDNLLGGTVTNEILNNFKCDKESYAKIKIDVDAGNIDVDELFPPFVSKYLIFSILENQCHIDFMTNNNLEREYGLFKILHDEISKEDIPIDI